jgi:magnesium chelatase subunit I
MSRVSVSVYPFCAIVGQDALKQALMLSVVDPRIGGVLAFGDRGTGKSTAIRGLAALLPPMQRVKGCAYRCDLARPAGLCTRCHDGATPDTVESAPGEVVDLPLGATEDRVVGALDLERALTRGERHFEPGLLARAHRGFLYIDEVNLLDDHLVDLLLDVAASGENVVEREGLSVRHPARFVLVGSGNPEEGELRPQLLDRFGLSVEVRTPTDTAARLEIIRRRDAYERDPAAFLARFAPEEAALRDRLASARDRVDTLSFPDATLERVVALCVALGADGLRGELTLMRAARARAALEGHERVEASHVDAMAVPALRHRLRKSVLDETDGGVRVERALAALGTV